MRCLGAALFLLVGYILHRMRWPDVLLPVEPDRERDRLRRVGRKRVLPLPAQQEGQR
jgi:hypothetical protein